MSTYHYSITYKLAGMNCHAVVEGTSMENALGSLREMYSESGYGDPEPLRIQRHDSNAAARAARHFMEDTE